MMRRARHFKPPARVVAVVLAAVTMALAMAGCGSYTKADFTARADAICASSLRALRSLAPPSFTAAGVAQARSLATYLDHALPIVQSEAKQLRALRRPAGDARQRALLGRYLNALSADVSAYERLARAAASGEPRSIAHVEGTLASSNAAALATAYGILSCGAPGATLR